MCGIVGLITSRPVSLRTALEANNQRGRDAWGFWSPEGEYRNICDYDSDSEIPVIFGSTAIANLRAEPTTEYVKEKRIVDVQPYQVGHWVIVHNGTIANDKEICSELRFQPPTRIDSWVIAALLDRYESAGMSQEDSFLTMLAKIVGSYAILAVNTRNPKIVYYAVNYRPLYVHTIYLHSMVVSSVPLSNSDEIIAPYSWGFFDLTDSGHPFKMHMGSLYKEKKGKDKALVVYSGGLDSTVAATQLIRQGYDVTLLHFDYGCRATGPERMAVKAVARRLNVQLDVVTTSVFTEIIKGSRLTNTKDPIAGGEAGAEYAHEWVPARNTILLSIALGIAEARGFDAIALGANLEEAGAYPDNEPEFLRRFNQLIPFAVGDGKKIKILTPVGNLMKHEIVKLGLQINAPMELSWSCYNAKIEYMPGLEEMLLGEKPLYRHCGHCGPCFMRRTAFEINGQIDPVFRAEKIDG